jgi:putative PIG3 family NAD(P)H quinone oxidoreductase
MHAITITSPGDPDVLTWIEADDPSPGPDDILIDVAAAGLNRADVLQRKGFYNPPPGASPYPGLECSGTVAAVGSNVSTWSVGDQVCALLTGGGYATRVVAPADHILPLPEGIDLIDGAALPEVVATVWSNIAMLAHLREGEVLLVHGGTSGIGTMAIQIARSLGARVVVTCGSDAKVSAALALGADEAINYKDQDFVDEVARITNGNGADVILDVMGAKYLDRNLRSLAVNGRLVVIGLQGGTKGELDLNRLLTKRAAVLATSLRGRPDAEKAAIIASVREHVWPLIAAGSIVPVIDRRMPITEVAAAHAAMEAGEHIGKILLTMP